MPPADFYVAFHYRVDTTLVSVTDLRVCLGFFFCVAKSFHQCCCVSFQHDKLIDTRCFLLTAPIGSVLRDASLELCVPKENGNAAHESTAV